MSGDLKSRPSIEKFITDDNLVGYVFPNKSQWKKWFTFMKTCFAEPLDDEELEIYRQYTGRLAAPIKPFREVWLICGRRAGKSRVLSIMAIYLGFFLEWKKYVSVGEIPVIMIVAQDKKQAGVIFNYIKGTIDANPLMKRMVVNDTNWKIELISGLEIRIQTASFKGIRGYTVLAALFDEIAFWPTEESSNPDEEILKAVKPGMATIPNAMLFAASSPFAKRGVLYSYYKDFYGVDDDDILVWKAPTWEMNPTIPQSYYDREFQKDRIAARTEYGAEFREDISSYMTEELLDMVTDVGVIDRPYSPTYNYYCFIDPSGGMSDSFTMAIAHKEGDVFVIDHIEEAQPPFDAVNIARKFSQILKKYNIKTITGDRYGGTWPSSVFEQNGINYKVSKKTKTEIYRDFIPLITGRQVRLLDNQTMRKQFLALERTIYRGSMKEIFDHPKGGHDDVANVVAGVCVACEEKSEQLYVGFA